MAKKTDLLDNNDEGVDIEAALKGHKFEPEHFVNIYVMGREYKVPAGLTIMKALEYAGYRYVRGCGCRAGFCGACATVYRKKGDYKLYTALACQTAVEDGLYLAQLPFVPSKRVEYKIDELKPNPQILIQHFPEIARCVSCNTCTKACPQDLDVMYYIEAAKQGDLKRVAELSFDCIQCGLCTMRCPAEITHYNVAQLARRLYGKYMSPTPAYLDKRVKQIKSGMFDKPFESLMKMNLDELKALYTKRRKEPQK